MEELQNLIKFLKTKGLKDQKIPLDVWVGIIEYFASKQETKQCDIPVVSQQRELFGERYPMTSDQPAQIDCRMTDCRFHKNGACKNVAPALTFDENKTTCWTRISEPNCG